MKYKICINFLPGAHIEAIAVIRDVFVIVFTGVLTLLLLAGSIWGFRLYRSTRRVTQNLEEITGILLHRVARPLSIVPPVMDVVRNVVELVQEYRNKDRTSDDDEKE